MNYPSRKANTAGPSFARMFHLALMALALLRPTDVAQAQDRSKNPQYGFAHRVNTAANIFRTLDSDAGAGNSAATGIEFDISYHQGTGTWLVSHGEIKNPDTQPSLQMWLAELRRNLDTGKYNQTFAALYVDVKTPNDGNFETVMTLVRQYVPTNIAVIYALNPIKNFETETTGYDTIKRVRLLPNEGISCWAEEVGDVARYYAVIERDKIERACIDHGHFTSTNNEIYAEANKSKYHDITDPYRLKKVIAWTFDLQSSMERYVNPASSYHTDALLVGDPGLEYLPIIREDLDDFDAAISKFSSSQRKADRTDTISFWERCGKDYVSGRLIYVNSSDAGDAGTRQTGTRWEPYGPLMSGVNALANGGKLILASKSLYSSLPVTLYPGVTRIAKECRIEKSPEGGAVRITRTR